MTKNLVSILLVFTLVFSYQFPLYTFAAPVISSVSPTSDDLAGGSNITINGSGFTDTITAGSLDTSFATGTGANGAVLTILIQSDGKIIISGQFTSVDGVTRLSIARLNTDGSLDTSFGTTIGLNAQVIGSALQNDGKILVGGTFTNFNGISRNRIARLNTNGSLDTSFVVGTGLNAEIREIAIQSDEKIVAVGFFTTYNGNSRNRILRINTDGSLDTSFLIGSGFNQRANSIKIQNDGKILVGGQFSSFNGTSRVRLARLNSNGTLDTGFVVGGGANNIVYSISVLSDDKIIIGGQFTSYDGNARNRIVRLNTDGSLDLSFNIGTGAQNIVFSTSLQSNDKIIIGGQFTSYNGTARGRIARINPNTNSIAVTIGSNPCTTLVFVSVTSLTCTVPAGVSIGFADVEVINPNLESFILSGVFQYTSPIFLAFQVRNASDTESFNNCNLGTATTSSVVSCNYRLKVSTNTEDGVFVLMSSTGNLVSGINTIQNAAIGTGGTGGTLIDNSTSGTENYGARITKGSITGGVVNLNTIFDAGANSTRYNYNTTTTLLETTGPNSPANTDTVNTSLITHNLNISASTPAGQYTQSVIYTIVPKI